MTQNTLAGADIGGTFTDLIIVDPRTGAFRIGKTLTTPDDPSRAVETVLDEVLTQSGLQASDLQHLIHGTTLVTNALIERKGAKTALITTQGFRDSIEIGRESRYDLYDLMLEQPKPLVPQVSPIRSGSAHRCRMERPRQSSMVDEVEQLGRRAGRERDRSGGLGFPAQLHQL